MTCRIQQNPPSVRVRLAFGLDGPQSEQASLSGVQVVDAWFYMGLLFLGRTRPGGTAVVCEPVEAESGCAVLTEQDEVISGEDDREAEGFSIEAGQLGGVGAVERDS